MSTCVLGRYVAATVLLVLYTQIFRRALTVSVWTFRYAEIRSEWLFSDVTSSGRVCRKVPKSVARMLRGTYH